MNKYKKMVFILLGIMVLASCRILVKNVSITSARKYKYEFGKYDSLYIKAFKNQDSSFLIQDTTITIFKLNSDSLIIDKGNKVLCYYKNYFESFEQHDFKVNELYWYRYSYTGELIVMKYFFLNELQYEKVNINGKVYLRVYTLTMPSF